MFSGFSTPTGGYTIKTLPKNHFMFIGYFLNNRKHGNNLSLITYCLVTITKGIEKVISRVFCIGNIIS